MTGSSAVTRLRPIRVLLVAHDRRFLRTANVLLSRQGCEVFHLERPSELLDQAERQRPNVVVLDGSDSLSATAKAVAALEAMPTPVYTVVVYEATQGDPLRGLRMVPKWGAFSELMSEVQRLYDNGSSASDFAEEVLP